MQIEMKFHIFLRIQQLLQIMTLKCSLMGKGLLNTSQDGDLAVPLRPPPHGDRDEAEVVVLVILAIGPS